MPRQSEPGGDGEAASASLARLIALCQADQRFLAGLRAILRRADQAVGAKAPTCRACGECCRFDRAGHRLYATAGELALLMASGPPPVPSAPLPPGRCPYQEGNLCIARDGRPLACRTFFCHEALQDWSGRLCERFHRQIRRLHDRRAVPYCYLELTGALARLMPPRRNAHSPGLFGVDRADGAD